MRTRLDQVSLSRLNALYLFDAHGAVTRTRLLQHVHGQPTPRRVGPLLPAVASETDRRESACWGHTQRQFDGKDLDDFVVGYEDWHLFFEKLSFHSLHRFFVLLAHSKHVFSNLHDRKKKHVRKRSRVSAFASIVRWCAIERKRSCAKQSQGNRLASSSSSCTCARFRRNSFTCLSSSCIAVMSFVFCIMFCSS